MEVKMMEERGIEISTVGKHARNLRAIFKMALTEEFITNKEYPFGRYKYVIPEVTQAKKSLSRKMMADLMRYEPANYFERRAISYFKFSYFGNGMNLKDMAHLKFKDWKNDVIYYSRKKTKNTTNRIKVIKVIVTEEMQSVINFFGNPDIAPDNYVFPIIAKGMDDEKVNSKVHTRNRSINCTLKRISKKLCFDKNVTLGMARHSFANALKQEGASVSFIQESLGHGSASITEHYMNSFEDTISKEHIKKLKRYFSQ
ncbi:MAG TPA: tyrosine-type recombinase/integrase [Chitinophagaceae bacterium]|jgi:site-specific recombinase XerD